MPAYPAKNEVFGACLEAASEDAWALSRVLLFFHTSRRVLLYNAALLDVLTDAAIMASPKNPWERGRLARIFQT